MNSTEVDAYVRALQCWRQIYKCFPKHLSKKELQGISVDFCARYMRTHGFGYGLGVFLGTEKHV